jgi:hypothetical protein
MKQLLINPNTTTAITDRMSSCTNAKITAKSENSSHSSGSFTTSKVVANAQLVDFGIGIQCDIWQPKGLYNGLAMPVM